MSNNNSNLNLTLKEDQQQDDFLSAALKAPILSRLILQLEQACDKAIAQNSKGQLKGKHNNSAEQHVQNAKRLSDELNAHMTSLIDLTSNPQIQTKNIPELRSYFANYKRLDMMFKDLLATIQEAPLSSTDVLESKI
ncbi:hypothetical protein MBANPS3_000576 [Mucor bainieri]